MLYLPVVKFMRAVFDFSLVSTNFKLTTSVCLLIIACANKRCEYVTIYRNFVKLYRRENSHLLSNIPSTDLALI